MHDLRQIKCVTFLICKIVINILKPSSINLYPEYISVKFTPRSLDPRNPEPASPVGQCRKAPLPLALKASLGNTVKSGDILPHSLTLLSPKESAELGMAKLFSSADSCILAVPSPPGLLSLSQNSRSPTWPISAGSQEENSQMSTHTK